MKLLLAVFLISFIGGFVLGALVYRNNAKKFERLYRGLIEDREGKDI